VAIDSCVTGEGPYFVGHDLLGLFAGLLNLRVGDSIDWYNAEGQLTVYRVYLLSTLPSTQVSYVSGSAATFQTCTNATGVVDRLVGVSAPAVGHPGLLVN
jgi:sortase (surface protein transpeptidase)